MIAVDIWKLPGPQHFFSELSAMLRRGSNVVLRLPLNSPEGIEWGLREHFIELGWVTLEVADRRNPIEVLFNRFWPEAPPEILRSAATVANSEPFQNHFIWLDGIEETGWPEWRYFLDVYKHACRSVPDHLRTVFVVPVNGDMANILPEQDATLTHVTWDDIISEYDVLIWAALRLRERGFKSTKLEILLSTICKVALWDIHLASMLVNASTENILNPSRILRDFASERKWDADTPAKWENGTVGCMSGICLQHSAFLLASNQTRALTSRIWAAQASVLLPKVEQKRLSLLPLIERHLQMPFHTGYSTINDPNDLEIGHLFFQLCRNAGVDPELRQTVSKLKDVRNSLSHLQPLSISDLLDDSLFESSNFI